MVRKSNYELMRIVSMFLIVVFHIIMHGQVYAHTEGINHFLFTFIYCITLVHVNSFILLMGYFNYNKQFSFKKFFSLFNMAWFYQIAIIVVLCLIGLNNVGGIYEILDESSPLNNNYWFIICYLVVFILSPFINTLIVNLSQKNHRKLIIILLILYSVIPFITGQEYIQNKGFTVAHFIFLYLVGAYLKKYPIESNLHFKNYSHNKRQTIFLSLSIIFCTLHFIVSISSTIFLGFQNPFIHGVGEILNSNLLSYSAPFVVLQTIFYFLWFGTLKIQSKKINYISSLVFGVYLIHENHFLRKYIYIWLGIDNGEMIYGKSIFLKVFVCAIAIMVVCLIIEAMRKLLFKFIGNRKVSLKIKNKISNYVENF